jgi:hypothetical protein
MNHEFFRVLAIAKQNTERRRCVRWRVHPELAECLPLELTPLTSGRQGGFIRRELGDTSQP